MATYISLVNYTEKGIGNIKDSPGRLDAARKLASSLGGGIKEFYLTMGAYDLIVISEFPDDEAAARFMLTLGSSGSVRSTTLRAFPEETFRDIIASLP